MKSTKNKIKPLSASAIKVPAVTRQLPPNVLRKGPPPIPARKGPPAIVAVQGRDQGQFPAVVAAERAALPKVQHRSPIPNATHLEFTTRDGLTTIVAPITTFADYSSLPGTIRYGKLIGKDLFRYAPGEDPKLSMEDNEQAADTAASRPKGPPPIPGSPPASKPKRAPSAGGKREGVCGFIDETIMEADGCRTAEEILELVLARFPGRDASATISTIKARPSHMRAAGKQPKPFKK